MSQAELKASLHAKIDALDGPHLALVERVLLTLEAEERSAQLDAGFDADRQAGLLAPAQIEAALAEARAAGHTGESLPGHQRPAATLRLLQTI